MSRWKRKGYIIDFHKYDHDPKHVHIYKNGKQIAKFNIIDWVIMSGKVNRGLLKIISDLRREGKI